jgi:hypothetical protein
MRWMLSASFQVRVCCPGIHSLDLNLDDDANAIGNALRTHDKALTQNSIPGLDGRHFTLH